MITLDLTQVPTDVLEKEIARRKTERAKISEKGHVCTVCRGTGKSRFCDPFSGYTDDVQCYACNGAGSVRF